MFYNFNGKTKNLKSFQLNNFDLIQKFNLKSSYLSPKINKIVFELPLNSLKVSETKQNNSYLSSLSLYLFFILFGNLPEIVYQKSKNTKINKIYAFRHTIYKQEDLNSYLLYFFLNNSNNNSLKNFDLFKKKDDCVQINNFLNNDLNLSMSIPLNSFFHEEDIFLKKVLKQNESVSLKTSFIFTFYEGSTYPNKMIQNIHPFWMSRCP